MRYFFLLFPLLLASLASNAQVAYGQEKVSFLDKKYKVPDSCIAETTFQVECKGSYYIAWLYLDEMMLGIMEEEYITIAAKHKQFSKQKKKVKVAGKTLDAWLLKYLTKEGSPRSELVITGKVKDKDIFIHIVAFEHVTNSSNIHGLAGELVQLLD